MGMFRQGVIRGNHLTEALDITQIVGANVSEKSEDAIEEILSTRTAKPKEAIRMAFTFAQRHTAEPLVRAAFRLIPAKCSGDPHDIKFPVAIFEDMGLVSSSWRPHVSAAAAFSFWGSDRPDLPVIQQVREEVRKLL